MSTPLDPDLQALYDVLSMLGLPQDVEGIAEFTEKLKCDPAYANARPKQVLLVEPEAMTRLSWRTAIGAWMPAFELCAEAETVARARGAWATHQPEVVVLDPDLDGGAGWALLRDLTRARPPVSCLVLLRDGRVAAAPEAMRAGACVVCLRREEPQKLLLGLTMAGIHLRHLSTATALALGVAVAQQKPGPGRGGPALSGRKAEVFSLLGEGFEPREIAARLGTSLKTVQTHVERLKHLLGVPSLGDLRRRALLAKGPDPAG